MLSFVVWERAGGSQSARAMLTLELAGGFVCAILGGYLAARISRGSGVNGIIALCAFTSLMALVSLTVEPPLKELALMTVFVAGVLAGGYLRAWKARRP
jgi:hypothetical protein